MVLGRSKPNPPGCFLLAVNHLIMGRKQRDYELFEAGAAIAIDGCEAGRELERPLRGIDTPDRGRFLNKLYHFRTQLPPRQVH
ncbi:hypothetical protein Q1695_004450 [Nippostrongylus brasiliensis]|nr:hypothetical protein Q1695_004450 [Nippostrongylus brasiliensis]